ncbi:MAG: TolB family protein, partial [Dongiaceae bacterium]
MRIADLGLRIFGAALIVAALGVAIGAGRSAQQPPAAAKKQPSPEGSPALGEEQANLPDAKIAGEIPAVRVSPEDQTADWPALAVDNSGAAWIAYIEWNGRDADRVVVRRRAAGGDQWGEPIVLDDGSGDHYSPAIVATGDTALAIWSGQSDGNFDLYAAEIGASGRPGPIERLTRAPHSDFNARAAADGRGNVTVAWQTFRNGQSDIYARRRSGGKWGAETRISPSAAHDWEPDVALDSRGLAWISWDSYHAGNYDVFLRSFDGHAGGALVPITSEPDAQFHSSVAVDSADRVWVAWDEAGPNWGKDYSRSSAVPGSRGLHYSRRLNLRVWWRGSLHTPAADLSKVLTGRMSRYAELPELAVDSSGGLHLVFRHWTWTKPNEI